MAQDGTIKAIDRSTIHQIQSGQVIVDLCSVAKELVENSVDAGATAIDVRFKNQGLVAIEVQDNGAGISPVNYESIALKHYTSKLSTYDDLSTLQTFGFRGEALSSLCALSHFYITTCTQKEAPRARKLEFETSGKLKSTSIVSGQKGTTVVVENLFRNLPVRRRELERNIKREWGKVISLLNQYACIQTGVKFTVSHQLTKGKRMVLFSTKGNPTTRENIINVFGVKAMAALVPLDLNLELTPTTGLLGKGKAKAADDGGTTEVRIQGHVSRPAHGEGRQTPDRQMFYVNGRPCQLPQFAKVFNEVYRQYNTSQSPFIFADIQLDTHLYDVNVSPDKRTILLHDQGQMLDNLRESLIELFEMQDATIPVAHAQAQKFTQTPLKAEPISRSATSSSAQGIGNARTAAGGKALSKAVGANSWAVGGDFEAESGDEGNEEGSQEADAGRLSTKSTGKTDQAKSQTDNLLARWLGKKPDSRLQPKLHNKVDKPGTDREGDESASNALKEHGSQEESMEDVQPASSGQDSDPPSYHAEKEDFPTQQSDNQMDLDCNEPPVPSIPPPSQPLVSKPGFVPASRLLKRSTQEVATITIGDESVTSVIGSTAKRARLSGEAHMTKPVSSGKPGTRTVPLPSFGGRLSQMFSASASASGGQVDDIEIETHDVEVSVDEESVHEVVGDEEEEGDDSLFVSQPDNSDVDGEDIDNSEDARDPSVSGLPQDVENREEERGEHRVSDDDNSQEAREASPHTHCGHTDHDHEDSDYIEEDEKKAQEDKKVQQMIDAAEAKAAKSAENTEKRTQMLLKGRPKRKDATLHLVQHLKVDNQTVSRRLETWIKHVPPPRDPNKKTLAPGSTGSNGLEAEADRAEEKLALKISKSDFGKMRVVGQFNLGFILAVREKTRLSSSTSPSSSSSSPPSEEEAAQDDDDELFIIDQHASDEKYNFERLQSTTVVQSQRLVQPKTLELTALEEEVIIENLPQLESNGFGVSIDQSGEKPVGLRCILTSLPLSRETTFSVSDLEELIFLLSENPVTSSTTSIPRPSKVRRMFAMRACRSSIMIGRALSTRQMERVVRHMGEMEKPWNCPHGRPTMRHLCGLGAAWDGRCWLEGDWTCSEDVDSDDGEGDDMSDVRLGNHTRSKTDWAAWVRVKRQV